MKLYYNGVFILQFKQNKNSNYQYHLLSLFDILFANILYEITYMCFWLHYIISSHLFL